MVVDRWRRALLDKNASLQQAIRGLEESATQIVLVVDDQGILLGTLTDGDIRRGLLRGVELDSPVEFIMHRDALVVPPQMSQEMALHLMQVNVIHALPIVDTSRRVVGLHLLKELLLPAHRANPVVIMAGGRGTRLRPHTENCPKPLIQVGGKPMLEHIIERANAEGFRNFILAIHYLGHMIEDYFGDGSRWDVRIDYLREDVPLGTAGALSLLEPAPQMPFLVTNGDVLTDIRYGELLDFHCRHSAAATMAVRQHEWQHPFGVVHIKGVDIIGFEEKPIARSHINAGVYVLEPVALRTLVRGEHCDMPTLFGRLQEQACRTIVYPMHEPWLDVGRPDDLERAHQLNLEGK
ncbi:nucleotidyltransferase family protein [Denitratisoma sp. agr-D3]